jgi:single-strand DNA-binding protein
MARTTFNSYQHIQIAGKIAKEPEMRFTPAGKEVTSISIPVEESWLNASGERVKVTTWYRVTFWEKSAIFVNTWSKKGTAVLITGKLVVDPATGGPKMYDKTDGSKGTSFEIQPDTIVLLANAKTKDKVGSGISAEQEHQVTEDPASAMPAESDLPF